MAAGSEPVAMAGKVLDALQVNGFTQNDGLIFIMSPALGPDDISHLKHLIEELGRNPVS